MDKFDNLYALGAVNSNEATWEKLLQVYEAETDASEKLKLINGLANTKDVNLLKRY